ncbi:hypothetical protein L9F63_020218, partial [Diploptera punctata]
YAQINKYGGSPERRSRPTFNKCITFIVIYIYIYTKFNYHIHFRDEKSASRLHWLHNLKVDLNFRA